MGAAGAMVGIVSVGMGGAPVMSCMGGIPAGRGGGGTPAGGGGIPGNPIIPCGSMGTPGPGGPPGGAFMTDTAGVLVSHGCKDMCSNNLHFYRLNHSTVEFISIASSMVYVGCMQVWEIAREGSVSVASFCSTSTHTADMLSLQPFMIRVKLASIHLRSR